MPRETEKNSQSIEPEQIVASEGALSDQLEIHTIPDKYYGAAMRASIEESKKEVPTTAVKAPSGGGKKNLSLYGLSLAYSLLLLLQLEDLFILISP